MALSTNEALQLTKMPRDGRLMKRDAKQWPLWPVYG